MRTRHYLIAALASLLTGSCTEEVDTSVRYVFKHDSVLSYLQKHEAYSTVEHARLPRERRVMPERAVSPGSCPHFYNLICRERNPGREPCDSIADGYGIVQRPERIAQQIESRRGQPFADFIGKTTAQHGNPVMVGDGHRCRVQRDRGLEFHENKNTYFLRIFAC